MTREIGTEAGGNRMAIHIDEPQGGGPRPAIVVIHHRDGVDEFTRAVCARLAQNGCVAAAPTLYHRRPEDEDSKLSRQSLTDGEVCADIDATVAALQKD